MKEKTFDQLGDTFIGAWYMDETICDKVVDNFHRAELNVREDKSGFRNYRYISNELLDKHILKEYVDNLGEVLNRYTKKYPYCKNIIEPWSLARPFNIQMYEPGKNYNRWHSESIGPVKGKYLRHLTFMTYLNNINDGGETEFLYQNLQVKPEKGLTLIWPAEWTHMHRGLPANNEVKYIATGWYIFNNKIV
jgi:hypothetical protein